MGDYYKTCMHYHVKSDYVLIKWALGVESMNANWRLPVKLLVCLIRTFFVLNADMVSLMINPIKAHLVISRRLKKKIKGKTWCSGHELITACSQAYFQGHTWCSDVN